jgi:hypothetical protein
VRDLIQRLEKKDIVEVSNPRVRLEDFFLRIVKEAQAANIRTFGAVGGGAVPDFLKQPAETTTRDVVESLVVSASPKAQPVSELSPPSTGPPTEPSKEVIEQLLGTATSAEQAEPPAPEIIEEAPPTTKGRRPPVSADTNVIEGLLGKADRDTEPSEEDQS